MLMNNSFACLKIGAVLTVIICAFTLDYRTKCLIKEQQINHTTSQRHCDELQLLRHPTTGILACIIFMIGVTTLYLLHKDNPLQDFFILSGMTTGIIPALEGTVRLESALFCIVPFTVLISQGIGWLAYSQLFEDRKLYRNMVDGREGCEKQAI